MDFPDTYATVCDQHMSRSTFGKCSTSLTEILKFGFK